MIRTAAFLLLLWTNVSAWVTPPTPSPSSATEVSRREILASVGASALATSLLGSKPALALSQEEIDKANIVKGYKRLVYLLDNWEKETTVCKIGQTTTFGDECERTPLKVMDYLGYKSTNDPLFKVEKTLKRLGSLVPTDRDVDYLDAVENLLQNAEEASGMAYVSSWGEANPGGGKDRVEVFIERAKKNVIVSKESLATVIEILGLKV
mmetsp:Transcript_39534/g.114441  ORF Transcript_39534/g.114441 Transcript_39534/m.114441 type:complete len:209 (+) Transcript_39534:76-702(+)